LSSEFSFSNEHPLVRGNTNLPAARQLRTNGIDTLVLAGVHTSGVVLATVRQASDLDYRLVVVRDCCADPDAEVHAMLLDIVIAKQAAIVTGAELAGALPGKSS
jgi:nicotinamidase-related amidase